MGGKGDNGDDDMKWSDKNELAFLGILYDRVKKDPNDTPSFKSTNWQEMDEEMFLLSGERYGQLRLQGKFNRLRQKHRLFSELLEHTGVTYLSSSNTVNAPEDVWQMFFKIYRTFRKKGCSNYEMLGQVFNKSIATRHLHHASTQLPQLPPTSDAESSNRKRVADENVPSCCRHVGEMAQDLINNYNINSSDSSSDDDDDDDMEDFLTLMLLKEYRKRFIE